MFPVIFSLGPVLITSYGVLAVIAFFSGAFVVWKKGREEHFEEEELFDVALLITFWALVLARIGYIALNWSSFGLDVVKWVTFIRNPGLASEGAVLGGLMAVVIYAWRKKWPVWDILDIVVLGAMLANVSLFLAAFLNGSGYGLRTSLPWAVGFPGVEGARHPTQVYGMVLSLAWFWLISKVFFQYRTYGWYKGKTSVAASGLVANLYFVGLGSLWLMMGLLQPVLILWAGMDARIWLGFFGIFVGVVLGYSRSGRVLGEDLRTVVARVKAMRLPKREKKMEKSGDSGSSQPDEKSVKQRRRKRGHAIVAGVDVK